MIRSMTGYGRAVRIIDNREITVEIRSVNNRYLDANVKLPRLYGYAEEAVKGRIKAAISRGKVDVYISVNMTGGESANITVNKPVLESYLTALKAVAEDYGVRDDISVMSLSRLPDILIVEKPEEDEEKNTNDILSVVDEAANAFNAMREVEGKVLANDVCEKAKTILSLVEVVEKRSPVTVAEYRSRLTAKMQEILQTASIDENRILQEAAIYADKVSVDEETVRLRSHLAQLEDMLRNGGVIGRKLDFLLQELNREANTTGSKCNDLELSNVVVEIKAELEKIREQIQNIE